jgi:hypothetical protein
MHLVGSLIGHPASVVQSPEASCRDLTKNMEAELRFRTDNRNPGCWGRSLRRRGYPGVPPIFTTFELTQSDIDIILWSFPDEAGLCEKP